MTRFIELELKDYIKRLSERKMVPGGGSAAAVVAALGASLNIMVIRYSIRRDSSLSDRRTFLQMEKHQKKALKRLVPLINEDCRVFSELMKALAYGKKDVQKRFIAAAKTPLKVCEEAALSMAITSKLGKIANKNLMTDVGCAAHMLKSAFDSARLNVAVNLRSIKDKSVVRAFGKTLKKLARDIKRDFPSYRGEGGY